MSEDGVGAVERETLERLRTRLVALNAERYRLLEDIAAVEQLGVAEQTGDRSSERLVQEVGRVGRAEARRLVAQARDLAPGRSLRGEPLPPRYPTTARVLASGEIGEAHVAVIRRTMKRLERVETIPPQTLAWAEDFLADQATKLGPRGLEQVARERRTRNPSRRPRRGGPGRRRPPPAGRC